MLVRTDLGTQTNLNLREVEWVTERVDDPRAISRDIWIHEWGLFEYSDHEWLDWVSSRDEFELFPPHFHGDLII